MRGLLPIDKCDFCVLLAYSKSLLVGHIPVATFQMSHEVVPGHKAIDWVPNKIDVYRIGGVKSEKRRFSSSNGSLSALLFGTLVPKC